MYSVLWMESQEEKSSTLTIAGVLRTDLVGPIVCTAANKLETEKSAAFNMTVYCEYCGSHAVLLPEFLFTSD